MRQQHPRFLAMQQDEKDEVIAFAKRLMQWDSFFINMIAERGEEFTLFAAIGTATNKHLQAKTHEKFGDRDL
jgi:hypothetical protein